MADDVTLNAMSGGSVVATDEIASKHYQRVKLVHGTDGVNAGDVSTANGLPVQVLSIAAGDNNIGNVDIVSSALPTGAATETTLAALNTKVTAVDTGAVVVSSSALPTGAATSAKQDTAQTALDAIKTATELIDNAISGSEMQVDIVTMPNVTIANASLPVTDNAGSLTVDAPVGTPVFVRLSDGTSAITTLPVSLASVPSHAVTNAGTFATQVTSIAAGDNNIGNVDVVTLPALPAGTNNIGDVDILSIAAGDNNIGNVDVVTLPSLPAGTNNIGDVDVLTLPALPAGTNNIGDVDILSIAAGSNLIGDVALQGRTTGGLSIFRSIDLDESEEEVKGSAGTLYSIDAMNMTASPLYLKIYDNTAAGTTVGTTTPVLTYVLPTNGDTNGCGMVKNIPQGLAFATGITVAVTTGLADNNTGAPAANAAIVNIGYK